MLQNLGLSFPTTIENRANPSEKSLPALNVSVSLNNYHQLLYRQVIDQKVQEVACTLLHLGPHFNSRLTYNGLSLLQHALHSFFQDPAKAATIIKVLLNACPNLVKMNEAGLLSPINHMIMITMDASYILPVAVPTARLTLIHLLSAWYSVGADPVLERYPKLLENPLLTECAQIAYQNQCNNRSLPAVPSDPAPLPNHLLPFEARPPVISHWYNTTLGKRRLSEPSLERVIPPPPKRTFACSR